MSSAGAQAVAVALPGWVCRPSAWASIGLIWAISSCALRRSWKGSHRIMVVIWSPSSLRPSVARRLGEGADRVAAQRSLAELNYVHSSLNTVHLSRDGVQRGGAGAVAFGCLVRPQPRPAEEDHPHRAGGLFGGDRGRTLRLRDPQVR